MDTYSQIQKHFSLTKWVYLQGWGEPLENEHFIEMIRPAKDAKCLVGVTTNGVHLTEDVSSSLTDADIDLIVISFGGAVKESHDPLRVGSDWMSLVDNVKQLVQIKRQRKRGKPTVKISLIMTRLNMAELPDMVPIAADMGVDEMMVTNIDYLPRERCNVLRAFHHESPTEAFEQSLEKVHKLGKKLKVAVRSYPLKAEEIPMCEADPLRNVFFSVDGAVAPCVYLRIPKKGNISRIFMDKEYEIPQTVFGNINDEDLMDIWNSEAYREFRKIYEDRLRGSFNISAAFDMLADSKTASGGDDMAVEIPPLPEVCRTCYKAYGL